jgi:hypothetical protein
VKLRMRLGILRDFEEGLEDIFEEVIERIEGIVQFVEVVEPGDLNQPSNVV